MKISINNKELLSELCQLKKDIDGSSGQEKINLEALYKDKLVKLVLDNEVLAIGKDNEIEEKKLPDIYISAKEKKINILQNMLAENIDKIQSSGMGSLEYYDAMIGYYEVFFNLVYICGGIIGLEFYEELPDNLMPKAYNSYWLNYNNSPDEIGCIRHLQSIAIDYSQQTQDKKNLLEEKYTKELDKLLSTGWEGVLGKQSEIDRECLSEKYCEIKENIKKNVVKDSFVLVKKYMDLSQVGKESKKLVVEYYDLLIYMVWLTGGISFMNDIAVLPDGIMLKIL